MEAWFDGSESLPPNTMVGTSPNGWISDQLANQWLDHFIEATRDRACTIEAFNKRVIRESFKDREIYPVDGSKVLSKLSNRWDTIPDLIAPDLRSYGSCTPSPPPANLSSSSVENTPPKSTVALQKNQAELNKHADLLTLKLQRNLERIFHHNRIAIDHLAMANGTITRIRATQEPIQRPESKRQIKGLRNIGILTTRHANRSIATRRTKEDASEER